MKNKYDYSKITEAKVLRLSLLFRKHETESILIPRRNLGCIYRIQQSKIRITRINLNPKW